MTPTLSLLFMASALVLLLTRDAHFLSFSWQGITVFFVRQKPMFKSVGGVWFGIVGAPLAAWFLTTFFILPLIGINGYTLNIQTVLALSNPTAVIIFIALWLAIAFGFFGATVYKRNGKSKS